MRILLLDPLPDALLAQLQGENLLYQPDLLQRPSILAETLIATSVDAIVTRAAGARTLVDSWSATRTPTYLVRVTVGSNEPTPKQEVQTNAGGGLIVLVASGHDDATAYITAFELLEQEATRRLVRRNAAKPRILRKSEKTVILIGAGLVNLITAAILQKAGYAIRVVDASPDPRDNAPWSAYGCIRGGGDARMFSLSEMNNYHDKQSLRTMNQQFRRSVLDRGWAVHREGTLQADEWHWIEEFERIPVWLAQSYTGDIFGFNRESHRLWTEWQETDPELFEASYCRDGIVRLFDSPVTFESKAAVQQRLGAVRRILSAAQIAEEQPSLAEAVSDGYIAGGVDEVGFTVMAHAFMRHILNALERDGAILTWSTAARRVLCDRNGTVNAIQCDAEELEAHHFVASPGAYGHALLEGTHSRDQIHGVLGVWLTLPNPDPQLTHSLKLRRTGHVVEAANITVVHDGGGAGPLLILGSGYGYTGGNPSNIDPALLDAMYSGLVDTAEKYFRRAYDVARTCGDVSQTFRYCVRPWTASGLGIFEQLPTRTGGKYIVTGGHNTGGFAQAPAVAQAVLAALEGREHPMHYLYHPDRARAFLGTGVTARQV